MKSGVYDVLVTTKNLYPLPLHECALLDEAKCQYTHKYTRQQLSSKKYKFEPLYELLSCISSFSQSTVLLKDVFWLTFCCFYQDKSIQIIELLRENIKSVYKEFHMRLNSINNTRSNGNYASDCIDKAYSLFPIMLGEAIILGYFKLFVNSKTLFNEKFYIKILQLVHFEILGVRVSEAFAYNQYSANFKNPHYKTKKKASQNIVEYLDNSLNKSLNSELSDDYKDKLKNKQITKDISLQKEDIAKKSQTFRNQITLPRMRKKMGDIIKVEGTNVLGIQTERPNTCKEVNERFIMNEEALATERFKNNPKAEERNNPAVMMCTLTSPYLHNDIGKKLHGQREIKVNVSRYRPRTKNTRSTKHEKTDIDNDANMSVTNVQSVTTHSRANPFIKKMNDVERIKKHITDFMNKQNTLFETMKAKAEKPVVIKTTWETENATIAQKVIEEEYKRRKYAKNKEFKYLSMPTGEKAEFMEYLGNELTHEFDRNAQNEEMLNKMVKDEKQKESQRKLFVSVRRKTNDLSKEQTLSNMNSTNYKKSIKFDFPASQTEDTTKRMIDYDDANSPSKSHLPTYLAMRIIKANKKAIQENNVFEFEDEFKREIHHHEQFLKERTTMLKGEMHHHKISIPAVLS